MTIQNWLEERSEKGTAAHMARRMFRSGREFKDFESELRHRYILEALIANNGNQVETAKALGVDRKTVYRALKALGIQSSQVIDLALAIKDQQ